MSDDKRNVYDAAKRAWIDRIEPAAQPNPIDWKTVSTLVGFVLGLMGLLLTIYFGVASVIDARFTSFGHNVDRVSSNIDRVQHSVDRLQESTARDYSTLRTSIGEIRHDLQQVGDDVEEVKERLDEGARTTP